MPEFVHQGRRIHFLDEGEGPPLLLLHAFPVNAELFRPQVEALGSRYRFILPDLRGFGGSEAGEGPTTMEAFAEDALAVLDHLEVDRAVVGGVSMGGYISLALLDLDPSRVHALVLANTQMGADDEAGKQRREEQARSMETEGAAFLERNNLPKLLAQPPVPKVEDFVRRMIRESTPQGVAAANRGMGMRPDRRHILARFAGPALFIAGEKDTVTPRAKLEEMAALVAGSKVVEIPGAGHLACVENPGAFNEALDAFLRQMT